MLTINQQLYEGMTQGFEHCLPHRIHGAGIYANIWSILMVNVTIYSSTMDPMGMGISTISMVMFKNYFDITRG